MYNVIFLVLFFLFPVCFDQRYVHLSCRLGFLWYPFYLFISHNFTFFSFLLSIRFVIFILVFLMVYDFYLYFFSILSLFLSLVIISFDIFKIFFSLFGVSMFSFVLLFCNNHSSCVSILQYFCLFYLNIYIHMSIYVMIF